MFTDSHCHLSFPELSAKLPEIRQAMADAHVTRALCICTTIEEFPDVAVMLHQRIAAEFQALVARIEQMAPRFG